MAINVTENVQYKNKFDNEDIKGMVDVSIGNIVSDMVDSSIVNTQEQALYLIAVFINSSEDIRKRISLGASELVETGKIEFS